MAYRNNSAEGQTSGTSLNTGNSGGGSGDAFNTVAYSGSATGKYSSDTSMHSANSLLITTTTGATDTAILQYDGANDTSAAVRFYVFISGRPGAAVLLSSIRNASSGNASIVITGSNRLQIQDTAATVLSTFVNPLYSGVWYRVELTITVGTSTTGSGAFAYYLGDSATPVETPFIISGANFSTNNITMARFGKLSTAVAAVTFYFDDLAFDNGRNYFIGPLPPTATAAWIGTV